MTATARYTGRPWVAPEAVGPMRGAQSDGDLSGALDRAELGVRERSRGRVIHALVAVRAALRSRLSGDQAAAAELHAAPSQGPWKRRLRRRYAASLCTVDRLLDQAWEVDDSGSFFDAATEELVRLRRLESLENRAYLERHWTDLGVGD